MLKVGLLDIETSELEADLGIILCAVIKDDLGYTVLRTDELNKKWRSGKRGDDKAITKALRERLATYDIIVAHNGNRFDIPFVRTRCAKWKLERLPDIKLIDPCDIAWRKFRLRSNSLGNISDFIGSVNRKHRLDLSVWRDAVYNGTAAAMDQIVEHCVSDVDELEDVLNMVKPYIKVLNDRGSGL